MKNSKPVTARHRIATSLLFVLLLISTPIIAANTNAVKTKTAPSCGWLHGNCFATKKSDLGKGTKITAIVLDNPQWLSEATIRGPASDTDCAPLLSDRKGPNVSQGLTFYSIQTDKSFDLAIGVVGKIASVKVKNGFVNTDINSDGISETYSQCTSAEGIHFEIRNSNATNNTPIWSGYYYLGYDVERTCP